MLHQARLRGLVVVGRHDQRAVGARPRARGRTASMVSRGAVAARARDHRHAALRLLHARLRWRARARRRSSSPPRRWCPWGPAPRAAVQLVADQRPDTPPRPARRRGTEWPAPSWSLRRSSFGAYTFRPARRARDPRALALADHPAGAPVHQHLRRPAAASCRWKPCSSRRRPALITATGRPARAAPACAPRASTSVDSQTGPTTSTSTSPAARASPPAAMSWCAS